MMGKTVKKMVVIICMLGLLLPGGALYADVGFEGGTIEKWVAFFQPSALTKEEQMKELLWFKKAAMPLKGVQLRSAAESIITHIWERDVLANAFEEITGIRVEHNIIHEGELIPRITEQMMTGRTIYHIYVNDADMIGTHMRLDRVVDLGRYMSNEGRAYTNPWLDLGDFMNLDSGRDDEGRQLQIPDQQFPGLYWFRYDWFSDPATKRAFEKQYGYALGVPVNWAAYQDIAEFFTGRTMKNPDGSEVKAFGHMDYGKPSPDLGYRFTDAWLSTAGMGDTGLPNGRPVDEWGIRVENNLPVGSTVERGGALDGPAAVYALTTYLEWLKRFAPPQSREFRGFQAQRRPARGDIAQMVFMYTYALVRNEYHKPGSPMVGRNGKPVWRVAPTPRGRYWDEGMKVGYQDIGCWTLPFNVRGKYRAAAWLWAQFCVSKTIGVKKYIAGMTPVRKSTVSHPFILENAWRWGGLIEFFNSPNVKKWTGSGINVPHYPALSGIWWAYIAKAVQGELTPQEALTAMANAQDEAMAQLRLDRYSPTLNPGKPRAYWLGRPGAPKPERPPQKPQTIAYDRLIEAWGNKEAQ